MDLGRVGAQREQSSREVLQAHRGGPQGLEGRSRGVGTAVGRDLLDRQTCLRSRRSCAGPESFVFAFVRCFGVAALKRSSPRNCNTTWSVWLTTVLLPGRLQTTPSLRPFGRWARWSSGKRSAATHAGFIWLRRYSAIFGTRCGSCASTRYSPLRLCSPSR